jgi:hypothetical protein
MTDETQRSEDNRPLSPEERRKLRRLIEKSDDILDVASNFSHLGWLSSAMLKVAKWVAAIVAGIIAWQTIIKGGGPWPSK